LTNAYDEIAYPSGAFPQTHPDRLAAHALLFGLSPAPTATASVLEIGAGDGSNLIPMALTAPEGRFVGFDLAAEPVRRGNEVIAALGLRNIRLFQADILEVDRGGDLGGERFDYIIAQGVYSWVPPPVREGLMDLIGQRLAPGGVAYASFNALPGGYIRLAIRHELLFAIRGVAGLTARMEAAMGALQAWPAPDPSQSAFRRAMAEEAAVMKTRSLATLTHDELSEAYHPVYLKDYADNAARHGLQVLAGAEGTDLGEWFAAAGAPGDFDPIARAQQSDFDGVRFFCEPLLVGAGETPVRRPRAEFVARTHVSSRARRIGPSLFDADEGARFTLSDATLAGALERLAAIWPATTLAGDLGLDEGRLLALVSLYGVRALALHGAPSRFTTAAGERPMASPLARLQAARGETRLTTLRHTMRDVDDDFSRGFLASLDGTRTRAEIARDIAPRFNLGPEAALAPLSVLLDVLARAPLLVQ
jgi:SAM-dependent methyltransferase